MPGNEEGFIQQVLKSAIGVPQNPAPTGCPNCPSGYDESVHIAGVTEISVDPTGPCWPLVVGLATA